MSKYRETNYVEGYMPGTDARVELKNGRFVDVIKGGYFEDGTKLIIRNQKIESMSFPDGGTEETKQEPSPAQHQLWAWPE